MARYASPDVEAFGTRLTAARKSQGLSQTEMATRLGVSLPRYHGWEHGIATPNNLKLYGDICRHLSITVDWLFFGDTRSLPEAMKSKLERWSAPGSGATTRADATRDVAARPRGWPPS